MDSQLLNDVISEGLPWVDRGQRFRGEKDLKGEVVGGLETSAVASKLIPG